MANMIGMNVAECTKGKSELDGYLKELNGHATDVHSKIQESAQYWQGTDADDFRRTDAAKAKDAFDKAKTELGKLIARLDQNIQQQTKTSSQK